jgi:hypothetical protein
MAAPKKDILSAIPFPSALQSAKKLPASKVSKPKNKPNPKLVSYYWGLSDKEPFVLIRGKGLTVEAKKYLKNSGFIWKFRSGRKLVMAWESFKSEHQMIEILLHLRTLGCDVQPYSTLNKKKVFVLDTMF